MTQAVTNINLRDKTQLMPTVRLTTYTDLVTAWSINLLSPAHNKEDALYAIAIILGKIANAVHVDGGSMDSKIAIAAKMIYESYPTVRINDLHLFVNKYIFGDFGKVYRPDANSILQAFDQFMNEKLEEIDRLHDLRKKGLLDEVTNEKGEEVPEQYKLTDEKIKEVNDKFKSYIEHKPVVNFDMLDTKELLIEYIDKYNSSSKIQKQKATGERNPQKYIELNELITQLREQLDVALDKGFNCDFETWVRIKIRPQIAKLDGR